MDINQLNDGYKIRGFIHNLRFFEFIRTNYYLPFLQSKSLNMAFPTLSSSSSSTVVSEKDDEKESTRVLASVEEEDEENDENEKRDTGTQEILFEDLQSPSKPNTPKFCYRVLFNGACDKPGCAQPHDDVSINRGIHHILHKLKTLPQYKPTVLQSAISMAAIPNAKPCNHPVRFQVGKHLYKPPVEPPPPDPPPVFNLSSTPYKES